MNFKLLTLEEEDIKQYKLDMQEAFQRGYEEHFGRSQEVILPEKDIDQSMYCAGAVSYKAVVDGEMVGGAIVVINEATQHNHLDLLFVKNGVQSRGLGTLVKMVPVHISDNTIPGCIRSRKGRPFRVGNMDRTQMYLSQLGIFSNINMKVLPIDSMTADGNGLIDLHIDCVLDKPYEVTFEAKGTSKSNSFIGPSLGVGVEHKNLFGAGEQLSAKVNASYEWQTGTGSNKSNRDINSYEFGAEVSLAIPRLIAPKFIDRSRRYRNWTRVSLNGDIMNRPGFFKMFQVGAKFSWEWHASKKSLIEYTPFMLTYSKLLSTTSNFDSAMVANPAIALSFRNTFIPKMQYSYTYDTPIGTKDNLTWTSTLAEAGILSRRKACYNKKN